jgi:mRNA-degrading endonuclease RelE of RelBE toxin-antitoxin system
MKARFSEEFARDFAKLDNVAKRVAEKIVQKTINEPERRKRLTGFFSGCQRVRFLSYRIIYRVNEREGFVEFLKLKKRDEAYR